MTIHTSSKRSLSKLLTDYLEFCEVDRNLAQSTIRMYAFYLSDFLSWLQNYLQRKEVFPADITSEVVHKYRLNLNRRKNSRSRAEGYKRSTQKTFMVALRAFLKYLIVERGLEVLPPDSIILGRSNDRVPKVLDADQLENLFSVQDLNKRSGLRDRAILETLFSTGLRVSELVALNVEDINLSTGEFTVIGKGGKARIVYLSRSARAWLRRYLATRKDDFKPLFLRYSGKHMAENDPDGESLRLSARSIQRMVKKYARRAGLAVDATPHTLRHTFATDLLASGADLRSVQELLGHSDVSTTQIYTHITDKRLKEVHEKFHTDAIAEDSPDSSTDSLI